MCIISFHFQNHPKYKMIIAANRDEFYNRPTKEAHYWEDYPNIIAGRDLKEMGTWLGMTEEGRFAALTNYRDPSEELKNKTTRGEIVTSFLTSGLPPYDFLKRLHKHKDNYNGFNVLVGTPDELFYYGNRQENIIKITPGTHSISNHLLNTPWPKVERARTMLRDYVKTHDQIDENVLFSQLQDQTVAKDEHLPHTGVGLELERKLSPIFIKTDNYGTRSSTIIYVTYDNRVTFTERTYDNGIFMKEKQFSFRI